MAIRRLFAVLFVILMPFLSRSQDILVGWTFQYGDPTEVYANHGISCNLGVSKLIAGDTAGYQRNIMWRNGVQTNDYAATTDGWDNGDDAKFWQIAFMTQGYEDIALFSKQRSGEVKSGPKYFYLLYKVGSGPWNELMDGNVITLSNDWDTGVINNLVLPPDCNNASDSVYIRWMMHPNISLNGYEVLATGTTKIDDVFIKGSSISGVGDHMQARHRCRVYPNISSGLYSVQADEMVQEVAVLNSCGVLIKTDLINSLSFKLDLSGYTPGMYFMVFLDSNSAVLSTEKIMLFE
jgi:hypothetical protein